MAASTGGVVALKKIFSQLKPPMPPILIVQHMPQAHTKDFAKMLSVHTSLKVKEASNAEVLEKNTAYIAPGNFQMEVAFYRQQYCIYMHQKFNESGICPSADFTYQSVAEHLKSNAIGVILSGMGSDGTQGLLKMKQQGAMTIAQDEATSVVFGMPKVAIGLGAVQEVLPIDEIAPRLLRLAGASSV